MVQFVHPAKDAITLEGLLAALADPMRIRIVQSLLKEQSCMSCCQAAPAADMPKSTLSHHFRILREAGLVYTTKRGVENRNTLRLDDVDARFPGLLKTILDFASPPN